MNCHQVLSGACNAGDQCFAVGSVEGIPFTAYAAGCNIVILASNFERVQIIPGAIHNYVRITCLDCSTDTGKIAAAYDNEVCIFEPTPLIHTNCSHGLEYRWVQTGKLSTAGPLSAISWNLEGTRLLTGGALLQLWHHTDSHDDEQSSSGVKFEIGGGDRELKGNEEEDSWVCVWRCHTATPVYHLAFSPDGTLFATSGKNDRLVKIWYQNKMVFSTKSVEQPHSNELNYGFIYVAHPRALTHLSWRKTSKYMPKGSVGNMLVTSCLDNICRVWAETLPPEEGFGPGAGRPLPNTARNRAHRHKHRFMQRLKHMKTCFHIRRTAQSSKQVGTPIPTLPSTFSAHDFHNNYQLNASTAGLHFHLAASINAETDIPLVPSMRVGPNARPHFILHWLHNKEMHFTLQAETILHDLTKKILDKEEAEESGMLNGHNQQAHHHGEEDMKKSSNKVCNLKRCCSQEDSSDELQPQPGSANLSHQSLSNTTSINSIATDVTCTHLPDSLDAKIESLLKDWHHTPDLLFSIHPVDGSFLIWQVEWLDEYHPGSFRQAQVSFSTRIPGAFPLGDATTMSTTAALYHTAGLLLHVRHKTAKQDPPPPIAEPIVNEVSTPLASVQEEKEENEWPQPGEDGEDETQEHNEDNKTKIPPEPDKEEENKDLDLLSAPPCPVISMVTNHTNGTLNLWQLTFQDKSKFSTVLSIGHASRASGHRFRVNDITCHPVLPLLLTTSHHNITDKLTDSSGNATAQPTSPDPSQTQNLESRDADSGVGGTLIRSHDSGGFCSELILWRVDAVGPLSKSGGVGELARINSPHPSAFSNVAWIPTLLPSTTLGNLSNSPSACFVASDGESLRVYQAVIDARTLLAEVASSERKHRSVNMADSMVSISTDSSTEGIIHPTPLHDRIKIVSHQSTARPGCVIKLDAIADATHDWQNTQFLHVFQEQLITGERISPVIINEPTHVGHHRAPSLMESDLDAMVDLQQSSVFEEPFYIVVLEKTNTGTTVHMWRLVIASQPDPQVDVLTGSMMYVPDSALIQDADDNEGDGRKRSVSLADTDGVALNPPLSHVVITTTKVCSCELPLPQGVDVIHASPAAGHLSSASIYPACFAPYIITTACSDSTIRFWKCDVKKTSSGKLDYSWKEWEMINKDQESAIDITGQPLNVSAAYSGRIACAYKSGRSFTRPGKHGPDGPDPARYVNLCVAVYECESTGGSEWLLEDTIHLRNIHLPRVRVDPHLDLSYLYDTRFLQKKQRLTQVLQTLSHEDLRPPRNGETNLSSDSTKSSASLLAVPSFSTLQSLRKSITENGNTCPLTQKHLVQLDWVSKEDGSHILTVAVGSKVLLFTPVSSDLAQANMKAMKESMTANRPLLRKASSLAAPNFQEEIRWRKMRSIELHTADGLPPLPMQISWVRDGILVVGMDSEMHVYSQWKPEINNYTSASIHHFMQQESEDGPDTRDLRDEDLRPSGESRRRLANVASMPHLSRVSSMNLQLMDREAKRRKVNSQVSTEQQVLQPLLDYMPDFGLFEASRMACPVLPQYHPKQLMELLNSGKIRWVKAILAHLVRCLGGSLNSRSSASEDDSVTRQRGWSRTRTLSVSYVAGAASPLENIQQIPEELQLDYTEINTVPPLPLWTLLVADKERPGHLTTKQEAKDYNELFDGTLSGEEDLDELLQEEPDSPRRNDRRPSVPERQGLSHFGPRQGRILSRLLTHTHLPGLSSLDQMHLLALADTVSTCKTDFAERFTIDAAKSAISKENLHGSMQGEDVGTEALDDCGLRFLLAMKHYGYLLRCLPLGARAPLQRQGVGSANVAWAFHSESAEQLLMLAPGYAKGVPKWCTLKELGVGWWVRNPQLLRTCMERVARAAYQAHQDPMDAALYYLAMKKKALLWGLFRSKRDEKMTAFFSNDFNQDRWRKAAKKNAYALLGRQRFEHAAAFFLLGDSLKDALEVILTRMNDLQLAMVVARMYNSESLMSDSFKELIYVEILGCDKDGTNQSMSRAHPDPFLRSMALWLLRDYSGSLATLLVSRAGQLHPAYDDNEHTAATGTAPQADPNVFNFYVYLRTHPLLVRQYMASQGGNVGILQEGEEGITRLERRLYFTTAHGHFKAGCPALALEVLSKLPSKIIDDHAQPTTPHQTKNKDDQIITGILDWGPKETTAPKAQEPESAKAEAVDWGAPSFDWGSPKAAKAEDELVLDWDEDEKGSEGSETPPLAMKLDSKDDTKDNKSNNNNINVSKEPKKSAPPTVDIMAQQLKFVACLKILMEELSTLATGFEVDGGHLRYQLYIWLEREVEALRQLCGYSSVHGGDGGEEAPAKLNLPDLVEALMKEREREKDLNPPTDRPTLHQVLLQEKADFEAKVQRAVRRKRWLKANETLLRTLLSYCSLQGAGGGGLASVRMELVLLLQELQQDKGPQQLLSPLPFPTTLPLLSASVACSKTVVADPVRHLQSQAHDMLHTIIYMSNPTRNTTNLSKIFILSDLAVALSACIYQSLCDSDTFNVKHSHPHHDPVGMESLARLSGLSAHGSHLIGGRHRRYSSTDEPTTVTTLPNKWPGVTNLRALVAREGDDDTPRLSILLCEAFVSCYLALLVYGLRMCNAHLLYRLCSKKFTAESWATLFGGGVKKLLRTASISQSNPITLERQEGASVWSSLRAQRARLNMRLLGATSTPSAPKPIKEGRPTYREHFVPPQMSMLSYLTIKPTVDIDPDVVDYDSADSVVSDDDNNIEEEDEEDVFGDPLAPNPTEGKGYKPGAEARRQDNVEHCDLNSYSWCIMKLAILRIAQTQLQEFLNVAGIEMNELAVSSPSIHGALRAMSQWSNIMSEQLAARPAPPRYIPACFPEEQTSGPPINKYRCILEKMNTPFNLNLASTAPAKRLWNFLVNQELVQDIFIRAIFTKPRISGVNTDEGRDQYNDSASEITLPSYRPNYDGDSTDGELLHPVRIIHKEQDSILAFCLHHKTSVQQTVSYLAVSSPRETQEMDITLLLRGAAVWASDECEVDLLALNRDPATLPDSGFLLIQHQTDKSASPGNVGNMSPTVPSTPQGPQGMAGQTGRGASVHSNSGSDDNNKKRKMFATPTIMKGLQFPGCHDPKYCRLIIHRSKLLMKPVLKHKIDNIKRMSAHPNLPLYLTGGQDGSVQLWEWTHSGAVASPRPPGTYAKVTRVRFSQHGNKFGVADGDGNLSLWQLCLNNAPSRPFFTHMCHNKGISDFTFLGNCSLVATAGHSSESKNVIIWDTLMPQKKSLVVAFNCHDTGANCICYAMGPGLIISGGRKGDICVMDAKARLPRHKFSAHDSAVKCLALAPNEDIFATGAADGDIKLWALNGHSMVHWFPGEHARSSFFKHIGQGVTQLLLDSAGRLFSCGADGTMKVRQLPERPQAHHIQ